MAPRWRSRGHCRTQGTRAIGARAGVYGLGLRGNQSTAVFSVFSVCAHDGKIGRYHKYQFE